MPGLFGMVKAEALVKPLKMNHLFITRAQHFAHESTFIDLTVALVSASIAADSGSYEIMEVRNCTPAY